MGKRPTTKTPAAEPARRERIVAPAKYPDSLIVSVTIETGALVRSLAGRAKVSQSSLLRRAWELAGAQVEAELSLPALPVRRGGRAAA